MHKLYLGLDIGSYSIKGVVIDNKNNIIVSHTQNIELNMMESFHKLLSYIKVNLDLNNNYIANYTITGSGKNIIKNIFTTGLVKNEIDCTKEGVLCINPNTEAIIEISNSDSKLITIKEGKLNNYKISNACDLCNGYFLESLSKKLNTSIEEMGHLASLSQRNINLKNNCNILLEDEIIKKISRGYDKKDIFFSLFNIIVKDYIEYFKGIKEINNNIIFVGGLSKCNYLITEFTKVLNKNIMVDKNSSYVTALGAAIYAKNNKKQVSFDFNTKNTAMKTKIEVCNKCPVNCEIVSMYIGDELVDSFGYNCEKGKINIGKSNYDKSKVN